MKKALCMVLTVLLVFSMTAIALCNEHIASSPWPTMRGDLQATGRSNEVGPENPEIKWTLQLTGDFDLASPIIGPDGTIYIGTGRRGVVEAINPDGTIKWSKDIGTLDPGEEEVFAELFSDTDGKRTTHMAGILDKNGTLYILAHERLNAIDSKTGDVKWIFKLFTADRRVPTSPAIGNDGTIYVTGNIGRGLGNYGIFAVNPDGTEKWRFNTQTWLHGPIAIGPDGTIYAGGEGRRVYAVNPDGTKKWDTREVGSNLPGYIFTGVLLDDDGNTYVGVKPNLVASYDPQGEERWVSLVIGAADMLGQAALSPDGSLLYIGSVGEGRMFHALDTKTGRTKWRCSIPGVHSSPIVDAKGTIYIGGEDGKVYAINPDGKIKWTVDVGGGGMFLSSLAMGKNGMLYGVNREGKFFAIAEK